MSEESLQQKYARERAERQQALTVKRNERAIRRLQMPASVRMNLEREQRIEAKRGEQGKLSDPRKLRQAQEDAAKDFVLKLQNNQANGLEPPSPEFVIQRATAILGAPAPPAGNKPGPQKNPQMPVDFYCWRDGKVAIITLYAMGEPSFV